MSNTSISIGKHLEAFTNAQVKSGRYGSVSEVIRAGLRILEEHETRKEALRAALAEGETSGTADYSLTKLIEDIDKQQATSENPKIKACDRTESDVGADMVVCPKGRTHRFARTFKR